MRLISKIIFIFIMLNRLEYVLSMNCMTCEIYGKIDGEIINADSMQV